MKEELLKIAQESLSSEEVEKIVKEKFAKALEDAVDDSHCWIVWDKDNSNTGFADCELAWTSFDSAVRRFKYLWSGMRQEDMKNKEYRIHPTQKPVALYKWIINKYANPGDKILDTHAGSASSLIACHQMGFDFLGFELDEHYYNLANKRLQDEMAQINLFDFPEVLP